MFFDATPMFTNKNLRGEFRNRTPMLAVISTLAALEESRSCTEVQANAGALFSADEVSLLKTKLVELVVKSIQRINTV
jgi:hypothetical protein